MVSTLAFATLALAATAAAQKNKYTASGTDAVFAARATAKTSSPTSHVKGKAFDRIAFIWLENTDFELARGDPNMAYFAKQGISLTNYHSVTHPSEPNYVASLGGDYFGMDNDDFIQIPGNVSTVIDLLESKGISWGEYQQDLPYSGFEGYEWLNQKNGANAYVRKHNPAVIYNSNANSLKRLSQLKNFTLFYEDLKHNKLPQWMFITPNMTSDGHDTSITTAGNFVKGFLGPLLKNKNFMQNTLVVLTFDENHTYPRHNKIFTILLGDAVPKHLVGTVDDSFYDHYSQISTVSANWGLHTLGRWDVGANVYDVVAAKTGDKLRGYKAVPYLNQSYAGPYNSVKTAPLVGPNIHAKHAGRTVLPSIVEKWQSHKGKNYYHDGVEIYDGQHPPMGYSTSS